MKCGQMGCNDTATHRVFWPGNRPIPTCLDHTKLAQQTANAIGLYVHVEEIKDDTGGEGEGNRQDTKGEVY